MTDAPPPSTVTCVANGPYLVCGPVDITESAGNQMHIPVGRKVALCRCGHATTKPFCDGNHVDAGFSDTGPAPDWAHERFATTSVPGDRQRPAP